jgi:hypothetical protein
MKTLDVNTNFIETYFGLMKNLSPDIKLDIIGKLTKTIKDDLTGKNTSLKNSFGAWQSENSAEEIIKELRESRNFNRHIEALY